SPKRRRRGLLSWSAMPGGDVLGPVDRPAAGGPIREISSQLSARNIRQSILRSKCSFASIRRRQRVRSNASGCSSSTVVVGDHTRSISDPTSAISAVSPAPTAASTISEASSTASRDSASTRNSNTMADDIRPETSSGMQTWHAGVKPLSQRVPRAQAIVYRQPQAFTHRALFELSECSSTLRGVPGHPAPRKQPRPAPRIPAPLPVARERPPEPSEIQRPAPVHMRAFDSRLRSQRCSSMPCATSDSGFPFDEDARPLARLPHPGIPDTLVRAARPFEAMTAGWAGRFRGVKNSLEIKQPMPLALAPATRPATAVPDADESGEHKRLSTKSYSLPPDEGPVAAEASATAVVSETDNSVRLLPSAVRLLRMFAFCGRARPV
ncbi:hypothetical protein LPJ75_006451, partial [Coemansia sp. RSA 2598]